MENKIKYFCKKEDIEKNAQEQLDKFATESNISSIAVFPDIHYCTEKNLPIGVAFKTQDVVYPLVTGKDIGCGVMYLRFSKKDWLKPFDKAKHYDAFDRLSYVMTDDGLGGGNHFLSIEDGDDDNMYIICHTGSRNLGIAQYQKMARIVEDYGKDIGKNVSYIPKNHIPNLKEEYEAIVSFAEKRRLEFVVKTLQFLQVNSYVRHDDNLVKEMTASIPKLVANTFERMGEMSGVQYEIQDSVHNHLVFENDSIIHHKGSTQLHPDRYGLLEYVIPLSMTRGSLIVSTKPYDKRLDAALSACSHGAGRKLSRTDTLKHWKSGMKKKERENYKKNFPEMLDRNGEFPNGYIQEFDFAYKDSDIILESQPYLKKIATTKPIATVKFTEI